MRLLVLRGSCERSDLYCSRPFSGPCENSDVVRVLPLPQSVRCRCMFAGVAQLLPVLPAAGLPGHTLLHTFTDDPATTRLPSLFSLRSRAVQR